MNGEKAMSQIAKPLADRIEALTEQLAAARRDAEEAEAYAEELEAKLEKLIGGAETVLEAWDSGNEASFREAIEEMRADVEEAKKQ
jgi:F0F1-type ATP synthase membrane subunit b/b'